MARAEARDWYKAPPTPPPNKVHRMSNPVLSRTLVGVLFAVAGWAGFSLQDAIVKMLVVRLSVPEVLFGRSLVIVFASLAFMRAADYRVFVEPRHLSAILLRAALILVAWLAYYRASRSLQLADLVTYYFVAPLFVVALSSWMLGEVVGLGRWFAVALGFGGVLIAANPAGNAPLEPVALALLSALSWAMATVLARSLSKGVTTQAMMFASAAAYAVACGCALPFYGATPTMREIVWTVIVGLVGAGAQYLWFEAVRRAQASLLAPLEYTLLPYSIVWGYLFFADWPSLRTLGGASVILASGLLAMAIELRRRRIVAPAT